MILSIIAFGLQMLGAWTAGRWIAIKFDSRRAGKRTKRWSKHFTKVTMNGYGGVNFYTGTERVVCVDIKGDKVLFATDDYGWVKELSKRDWKNFKGWYWDLILGMDKA